MKTMNLIQEICLAKGNFDKLPKWRFLAKKKALGVYEDNLAKFRELEIFAACSTMITFLISLDKTMVENISLRDIKFTSNSLTMVVNNNDGVASTITYLPKNGIFDVQNSIVCYTIYKNSRPARHIKSVWEELCDRIKEKCMEAIMEISNHIQ
jgi:hypothetical protein